MEPTPNLPSMSSVRSALPAMPESRHARRWLGAWIGAVVALLWVLTWVSAMHADSLAMQAVLATLAGTWAGLLVVLGHDAAHGSLTPWRTVNTTLARVLLLPAWQPANGWRQAHRRHHAHTNLKALDDGYPPPSPQDWLALPAWRRWHLRIATTLPGLFLFYLGVWWQHVLWPPNGEGGRAGRYRLDSLLVLVFVAVQLGWVASRHGGSMSATLIDALTLVAWPFLVSMWWVSAITLQQHRHPRIRWFDDAAQWSQFRSQVGGTVHLRWPGAWSYALFNIFEHTAHHADPRQPFTTLRATQRALQAQWPADVVVVDDPAPWKLAHLRHVLRECQLYDYAEQRWLRFADVADTPARRALR